MTYSNACKWTPAALILFFFFSLLLFPEDLQVCLNISQQRNVLLFLGLQVYPAMDMDSANSVVLQALTQATSQDTAVLKPAEEQLRQWETQPGFYSVLLVMFQSLTGHISMFHSVYILSDVCVFNRATLYRTSFVTDIVCLPLCFAIILKFYRASTENDIIDHVD